MHAMRTAVRKHTREVTAEEIQKKAEETQSQYQSIIPRCGSKIIKLLFVTCLNYTKTAPSK